MYTHTTERQPEARSLTMLAQTAVPWKGFRVLCSDYRVYIGVI